LQRLKIAVKYCGGCNPGFDRAGFVKKLLEDFPSLELSGGGEGGRPLTVNGCRRACVKIDGGGLAVCCREDFDALRGELALLCEAALLLEE